MQVLSYSKLLLLLHVVLLHKLSPAFGVAIRIPSETTEEEPTSLYATSNSILQDQQSDTAGAATTTEDTRLQGSTPPESEPCSKNNTSIATNTTTREKRIQSIKLQLLARLNLTAPPAISGLKRILHSSGYYQNLHALEQISGRPQECIPQETTYFSKSPSLYYPNHFEPIQLPLDHFKFENSEFQRNPNIGIDGKGVEEEKSSSKKADNKEKEEEEESIKDPYSVPPIKYSLRFDALDLNNTDNIWSVQLLLFKRKATLESYHPKRGVNPIENVKVYHIISDGYLSRRYEVLASKNVPSETDDGFVSFNITSGIKNWLTVTPPHHNLHPSTIELEVMIHTPEAVESSLYFPPTITFDVPSYEKGEVNARLIVERLDEKEGLVTDFEESFNYDRKKRATIQGAGRAYCDANPDEPNCCVRPFTVNFAEDLDFNFVISPRSFQPNYCNGQCQDLRWPIATKSTENLIKLRQHNPTAAPEPCCVPHDTRPLQLLMVVNGMTVIREFPNMIIDSCICR